MVSDLGRAGGFLGAEHELGFAWAAFRFVLGLDPPVAEHSVRLAEDLRDVAVDQVHGWSPRRRWRQVGGQAVGAGLTM